MESAVTIGLDLGKSVFQVHGVDDAGGLSFLSTLRLCGGSALLASPFGFKEKGRISISGTWLGADRRGPLPRRLSFLLCPYPPHKVWTDRRT
jgi:hypothetical protein